MTNNMSEKQEQIVKEGEWMVQKQLPSALLQLGQLLKETINVMNGEQRQQQHASPQPLRKSKVSSNAINGVLNMVGPAVVSADLNVSIPNDVKKSFRTQILATPLLVEQAQNTARHLEVAFQTLKDSPTYSNTRDALRGAEQELQQFVNSLSVAKDYLVLPTSISPESALAQHTVFNPPPPSDVTMTCHIDHAKLVIVLTTFKTISAPAKKSAVPKKKRKSKGEPGSTFTWNGDMYQVSGRYEGQCDIPALSKVLSSVNALLELAQRTKDKVSVLCDKLPTS